jgi:hypothetical protein
MVSLEKYKGAIEALGFVVGYACCQEPSLREDPMMIQSIKTIMHYISGSVPPLVQTACKVCCVCLNS